MKILATQGDGCYLIDLEEKDENGNDLGQMIDLQAGARYRPFLIHSIIARGYVEGYKGPQNFLKDLMKKT